MNRRLSSLLALALLLLLSSGIAGSYTVQAGDTLFRIAQRAGVDVAALQSLNHLSGTGVQVGQVLELPGPVVPVAPTAVQVVAGVTVQVPAHLQMGDAFVLRLSGVRASEAQVQFPSEIGEDVRQPNEMLLPVQVGHDFVVLGRVVLGKQTPLSYRVTVGGETLSGSVPVSGQVAGLQRLNMPPSLTNKLVDPARAAEEAEVERAYLRRTPSVWTQPFAPALTTPPRIATLFGQARTYSSGGPVEYHYGTDYLAPIGTPIHAINDGTVVMVGTYPVRGGLVVIDHGAGLLSMYFHQSKTLVRVGQTVKRGEQIGLVGSTGISNAPHLHLELRVRGEAVQPSEWLGKLLP
ncbi:peptidoglycan DD-metalloendopeptidase family protein [Deinococcus ruber]|uniref:Peptidase M23 n=1 Tax=Deinococcus ruber TaxID=1848197 RepID=A0A918KXA8_9DEIO|nr:M23 family metallopeptidase [Deinococcus ruber]GGR39631.1 peptidase M23 [Deinococcus ruber]